MKQIRKRLTYANVMSSIAVFLVIGGATAFAAGLAKNSVGTKQLKKNAVRHRENQEERGHSCQTEEERRDRGEDQERLDLEHQAG